VRAGDFVRHRRWSRISKSLITYDCIVEKVYEAESQIARDRILLGNDEWYCDLLSTKGEPLISVTVKESETVKEES
jgi:hypothetical protein